MTTALDLPEAPAMTETTTVLRAPRLASPLVAADTAAIVKGARRVLDEIGVECRSAEIRRRLLALKGSRECNGRIHYGDVAVEAVLASARKAATALPQPSAEEQAKPFTIGPPWCCLQLADAGAQQLREPTVRDSARAIRLLQGLGATVAVCPLAPSVGVPADQRNLAGLRAVLLHSPKGSCLTNPPVPEQIGVACDMAAAAGRQARAFLMCMISPLRFEDNMISYFLQHRDRPNLKIWLSGGMPCAGSTAPLHQPGALIQSLAESLAVSCCELALGVTPELIGLRSDPFDMRFGTYVIGSPEYQLFDQGCRAVFQAVNGIPSASGAFRSMAKLPDAQATAERAFTVLFQALQGARHFSHAGQMSMDEVFSPEQAVIDREILRQAERIVRGLQWRQDSGGEGAVGEALELIRQGVAAGNHLGLDYTLNNYKDFFHRSALFRYENAGTWQRLGRETILQRAAKTVEEIIAGTPEYAVSEQQAKEINRLYESCV